MKAIKKSLALVLALAMLLALGLPAIAASQNLEYVSGGGAASTDGRLIIGNAVEGRKYEIYKLFDATNASNPFDANEIIYSYPAGKTDFKVTGSFTVENPAFDDTQPEDPTTNPKTITVTEIDGVEWFTHNGTTIVAKDTLNAAAFQTLKFKAWAEAYGALITVNDGTSNITAIEAAAGASANNGATPAATSNEIEVTKMPYGYYMVLVTPNASGDVDPWPAMISINNVNKTASITDKNGTPHYPEEFGKKIQDEDNANAPSGSYGIDKPIPYQVKIETLNVDNDAMVAGKPALIYSYYVYDSINPYMTYGGLPAISIQNGNSTPTPIGTGLRYTFFSVPYEEVQEWIKNNGGANCTWAEVISHFASENKVVDITATSTAADWARVQSFRVDVAWRDGITDMNNIPVFVDNKRNGTTENTPDGLYDDDGPVAAYRGKTAEEVYGQPLYNPGDFLLVNYTAKLDPAKLEAAGILNDQQALESLSFENKAGFDWYNQTQDPNKFQPRDPKDIAPDQKANNYTVDLIIDKVDEDGNALPGAKFTLTGDRVSVIRVETETFSLDAAGTYWKLKNGKYTPNDPYAVYQNTDPSDTWTYTTDGSLVGLRILTDTEIAERYESATDKYKLETVVALQKQTATSPLSVTSDAQGKVLFGTVGAGFYTLTETDAPAGYNPINPKKILVVFNDPQDPTFVAGVTPIFEAYEASEVTQSNNETIYVPVPGGLVFQETREGVKTTYKYDDVTTSPTYGTWIVDVQGQTHQLTATIENRQGGELPSTGGIGTTIFYIVGSILLVGAGVVLFARRRVRYNED